MFGAGWTEMFIIGIVALVVIGPKDLPVVMRKIGRVVGTVRRMGGEFQRELNKTTGLDQITDLRRSITEPLRQTSEEIAKEFNRQTPEGVEPSGVMMPSDPKVESVYEQIAANAGVPAAEVAAPEVATPPASPTPLMTPLTTSHEPLPAPAEAAVVPTLAAAATSPAVAALPTAKKRAMAKAASAKKPPAKPAAVFQTPEVAMAEPIRQMTPATKPRARSAPRAAVKVSTAKLATAVPPAPVAAALPAEPAPQAAAKARRAKAAAITAESTPAKPAVRSRANKA